jgi:CspA family cold shock protein
MCSCTSRPSKKQGLSNLNEGAKVSYEETSNRGKTSAEI